MSASSENRDPRPAPALHRGELPVWPVLVVAALVLYLGLHRPSADVEAAGTETRVADHDGTTLRALRRDGLALDLPTELEPIDERYGANELRRERAAAGGEDAAARDGTPSVVAPVVRRPNGATTFHSGALPGGAAAIEYGDFLHGARHGLWEARWPGGGLRSRGHYVSGKRSGPWQQFAIGGALVEELEYVDGQRHGPWRSWSEEGELTGEGEYTSSLRNGPWVLYYGDGRVRERGVYREGLREGTWEFYDDLGRPTPRAGTYVA
ncbi:MAG: hypothetical protein AAFP86_20415, partial [Planctomycetota bacterium]